MLLYCAWVNADKKQLCEETWDITFMCACHAIKTSKHAKSAINCIKSEKTVLMSI